MSSPWTTLLAVPPASTTDSSAPVTLVPLPSLSLLTLAGPESMKFLQGQTTTDFREVEKGRGLPGAVCSLKGRVLFSFLAIPEGENVALVMPADQIEAAQAHLGKYAVFAKTRLGSAGADIALLGLLGPESGRLLLQVGLSVPGAREVVSGADGAWAVRMFSEDRYLLALPVAHLEQQWRELQADTPVAAENLWWNADIRAGYATVFAATRDLFQPQELNYPALEGVSYNKGCYTGQEVVARLYFRGKLKQRLYRLECETAAAPQVSDIFAGDTRVGDVVMAAVGRDSTALLAVVRNTAVRDGGLTLGQGGPTLTVRELPYTLPAEKEE